MYEKISRMRKLHSLCVLLSFCGQLRFECVPIRCIVDIMQLNAFDITNMNTRHSTHDTRHTTQYIRHHTYESTHTATHTATQMHSTDVECIDIEIHRATSTFDYSKTTCVERVFIFEEGYQIARSTLTEVYVVADCNVIGALGDAQVSKQCEEGY